MFTHKDCFLPVTCKKNNEIIERLFIISNIIYDGIEYFTLGIDIYIQDIADRKLKEPSYINLGKTPIDLIKKYNNTTKLNEDIFNKIYEIEPDYKLKIIDYVTKNGLDRNALSGNNIRMIKKVINRIYKPNEDTFFHNDEIYKKHNIKDKIKDIWNELEK